MLFNTIHGLALLPTNIFAWFIKCAQQPNLLRISIFDNDCVTSSLKFAYQYSIGLFWVPKKLPSSLLATLYLKLELVGVPSNSKLYFIGPYGLYLPVQQPAPMVLYIPLPNLNPTETC